MEHVRKQLPGSGVTGSLSIPVEDPDLFEHKATNELLLLVSRHHFEEFTIGELARQRGHTKPG